MLLALWGKAIALSVVCLVAASVVEVANALDRVLRGLLSKSMFWICVAVPAAIYILVVPVSEELLKLTDEPKESLDPNWSLYKEIAFRAAKFWVFSVFTYVGACIGSFLNVVAGSLPKGESIGVRNSTCPSCGVPISRTDNLPIYSYFNLGGKCRNCSALIPARYLVAELACALIFGSLFLYELVTGAFNVPEAKVYIHAGILWIIMYPKFDVLAIYLFHAVFMCVLLVYALVESDQKRLKLRHVAIFTLMLLIPVVLYFPLQPIAVSQTIASFLGYSQLLEQVAKVVLGGLTGFAFGAVWTAVSKTQSWTTFVPAFALTGVVLGWQSTIHVAVLTLIAWGAGKMLLRSGRKFMPTACLLFAVMVHHPLWKILYENLNLFSQP